MSPDTEPEHKARLRHGADAYASVLAGAGGRQLEALMRDGDRTAVCSAIYTSPPYELQVPALPVSRLSVNLTAARVTGGIAEGRPRSYETRRYSVFLAPAGAPAAWRKELPSRHLTIYFRPESLDADGAMGYDPEQPLFNAQLPGSRPLADELAAELQSAGSLAVEASDSLARLLLVRMVRHMHRPDSAGSPMSHRLVQRLRAYVMAHLSQRILVADLARHAGLPANRFAQAFTEFTRQTPYQFVLAQRLEHATQLLRNTSLSLAHVAHDSGFANQQHLCHAMRRQLRTTPSRYRLQHS
jgi:AraC family transcriptional regulator